jgi:hypothetical protein
MSTSLESTNPKQRERERERERVKRRSQNTIGRSAKSREARECAVCNFATVLLLAGNGGIYQQENDADWLGDLLLL